VAVTAAPAGPDVGFDPSRKQVRRPTDYVFVGAAVVAVIVLLLWALLA
jgi:hypothetical protein